MTKTFLTIAFIFSFSILFAQNSTGYWQQHVDYEMEIDFDAKDYQYDGSQVLEYTNNSPDTLKRVFYHMYFNAFQPGSEMDVRSRTIEDPDSRVGDRISKLSDEEIGFMRAKTLRQDGEKLNFKLVGTVLEVELNEPILPKESSTFKMDFEGQVPIQIRRSGRNNAEGVELSMTQWYPKMAEYDFEGWHADPYIGREFHGVWGNFDVKISIDKDFILGGSGYIQNPNEVGYGYEDDGEKVRRKGKKLTWHFNASNVHDFTWAADKDYIHDKITGSDGTTLHFLYKDNEEIIENWKNLQSKTSDILDFFNEHIGPYPYDQYSVIQGGDGGMEYAMCTLITGEREFGSLVGVTAHEMAHSWFQHILATDEAQHEWMDEGFTSYISALAMNEVMDQNRDNVFTRTYKGYTSLANSGFEQPQTTHADRYEYNRAYGVTAYSKGAVFLAQLGYLIGQENLDNTLNRYFDEWKFKHPTPNDFIRIAEKVSGAELSWYLNDWTRTTNTIDYAIKGVSVEPNTTLVTLERVALTPMPIEVKVDFKGGTSELYYIPLRIMRWTKPDATNIEEDWAWAYPTYTLKIPTAQFEIEKIEIDPSGLMADVNREDNVKVLEE
ncbi:Zn-dependent aminopeptidase, peptidase M1 family [Psychroflexus torquis ATCC 700755]|uniref:Zn-dependent aminopeptidase, peptidase M1 family n=1 Tax=Psychroflexus torquis (strain ATCC 700755 / CIP 106069 / ACAM 623) TaxID=313595 RepID=K4IGA0_PSYTT|nr:M1 family metallopeptidase [Psychroflexus torquis]AFU68091.1 Zn-dependent aminopeptidase, peptidase M1 family [Psychroflexus torquis ATCC 700755]